MLKGRDIEEKFRNMGHERATIFCIRELAEAQMALNTSQTELAQSFLTLARSVNMIASGTANMRKVFERIQKAGKFEEGFEGDKQ